MNVVVGGGIAGILSALLMQRRFGSVCLVEKDLELGGLYRSVKTDFGVSFDYGSHFLRSTTISSLNDLLFDDLSQENWRFLGNLRGGGYFGSKLNCNSPFIDSRCLPPDLYQRGILEVLDLAETTQISTNLEEQLLSTFGTTFTNHLFRPILSKKFFGSQLSDLCVDSHNLLGLGRIIGFTASFTRELKKSAVYDNKIAFHSTAEGTTTQMNYYPICQGISSWIELLATKMANLNIRVITGATVNQIETKNDRVTSVVLSTGQHLSCENIIWTIPTPLFLKAANISTNLTSVPFKGLYTSFYHFIFDRPFITDLHYVQCHEPHFRTFRVTLYPNIQQNNSTVYHLTSEMISCTVPDLAANQAQALTELVQMGVVSPDSIILFQNAQCIPNGFAVPSLELQKNGALQLKTAIAAVNNVTFLGRSSGGGFAAESVLTNVYNTLMLGLESSL